MTPTLREPAAQPMSRIDQTIHVSFDFPVVFTGSAFDPANSAVVDAIDRLRDDMRHRAMVFIDANVEKSHPRLAEKVTAYFHAHSEKLVLAAPPEIVPGGEAIKNDFAIVGKLAAMMLSARLSRHACVLVIGGGAVLDAVGLAASLVHRGLRLVRLPTTVLSQNDGGVGVKNGVNFCGQKNALGVFAPPFAVINDFDFLASLDDRQWRDGIAEAFKVAIIRDKAFFEFLCGNPLMPAEAGEGDAEEELKTARRHFISRCAELHLGHIRAGGDPFEFGSARPLDFGHWSAHKLETMSGFRISHGEAVAVGVLLDSLYAVSKGWLERREFDRIRAAFHQNGLPLWLEELDLRDDAGNLRVFEGLAEFQEHLGGKLCVTFPMGIGKRHEVHEIDATAMTAAITELRALATEGP